MALEKGEVSKKAMLSHNESIDDTLKAVRQTMCESRKKLQALDEKHEAARDNFTTYKNDYIAVREDISAVFAVLERQESRLKESLDLQRALLNQHGPLNFLSLPPEIRNMIYRFLLVEPHQGYLKCYYDIHVNCESKFYVNRHLPFEVFRVSRGVYAEASSLFYSENIFAIAEQNRATMRHMMEAQRQVRKSVDFSRVQRLHITNRECKWLSNPLRTSPGVFREASKHHISAFTDALALQKENQLKYLLVDVLSGFESSTRMVINIFRPLDRLTFSKIKKVHIVNDNGQHIQLISHIERYIKDEGTMPPLRPDRFWLLHHNDLGRATVLEEEKAGNELAAILKIKPCYPDRKSSDRRKR